MSEQHRFLVNFILSNQPQTIEIITDHETLSTEDAESLIRSEIHQPYATITDVQVTGLYRENNPHVHPGHYQQPEG